jgi:hypothetical protein
MATYTLKRKYAKILAAAWKPEYDVLAIYNGEKANGITHDPEYDKWAKTVQEDYNHNYLPLSRQYRGDKYHRRLWFG